MEQVFIYLLKSSGLIAVFYLAYHFLVRKETFFTSNRWFLMTGLFTSLLLPLFAITKVIYVERPKMVMQEMVPFINSTAITQNVSTSESFDWIQLIWISYIIITSFFLIKIVFNFISLYKMLYKKQIIKDKQFKLFNLNENVTPFSFFNNIVYNADLYSKEELESILLHEKIHSQQKHSLDVLIAELFCSVFWFNPFVWLYKKAIIQNLEYIADQKTAAQIVDKKSYQHALLKVVSNQKCLSITNNFYQSLIKKRIIMLNQNQSHKKNSWKYAVVIPALIGFVLLFQIKTIAQEKSTTTISNNVTPSTDSKLVTNQNNNTKDTNAVEINSEGSYVFDKISTDKELENDVATIKQDHNIDFVISDVKRNSNGEIIAVKMRFDDHKGNKGKIEQIRDIPIRPIFFKVSISKDGKNKIGFYDNPDMIVKPLDSVNESKIVTIESIKDDALIYVDGQRFRKEDLNELDPKGLEKIEILTDANSLKKYGGKGKNEVYIITTNWTTRDPNKISQLEAPSIITIENGDEVVVFDRFNMKIPSYPVVQFTDSSPVLIYNGIQQKNPRLMLESMNLSKIKDIKALNENDKEVKGTAIHKIIITTK